MASRARIRSKFQVTIPEEVRELYPLKEGQYVAFKVTKNGIVLSLVPEIDPSQTWFWSPTRRENEAATDADFRAGQVKNASSAEEAIQLLKGHGEKKRRENK